MQKPKFYSLVNPIWFKLYFLTFFFTLFVNVLISQSDPTQQLTDDLSNLCKQLKDLIPTTAMLLIMVGAVAYAGGQFFSAETRARATVWASSCIVGAIIGLLIAQLAPEILGMIIGQQISC